MILVATPEPVSSTTILTLIASRTSQLGPRQLRNIPPMHILLSIHGFMYITQCTLTADNFSISYHIIPKVPPSSVL